MRDGMTRLAAVIGLIFLSVKVDSQDGDQPPYHSRDFDGSKSCQECHPRQYLEWRGSTHAYALVDPLFAAEHRKAVKDTQGKIGTHCLECHSPIGVRSGELTVSFERVEGAGLSPQVVEGVSCEACSKDCWQTWIVGLMWGRSRPVSTSRWPR